MNFPNPVDFFIPEEVRRVSVNEYFRGRTLVIASYIAFFFVLGFTISRGMLEGFFLLPTMVLGFCTFLIFLAPFVYRVTHSVPIAGIFLTLSTTMVLMFFSFVDGGFGSTALVWFPVLPVFAMFFGGIRYGVAITLLLIGDLGFLVYAHQIDVVPANLFAGTETIYFLYLASLTGVIVVLIVLAGLYLLWQRAVQKNLLEVSKAKDEFLSGMSHELRTPLNSILGFSEVLEKEYSGPLNEKQKKHLVNIRANGSHMLSLVNDLLDSARIESGDVEFTTAPVDVTGVIESAIRMLEPEARKKQVNVDLITDNTAFGLVALVDEMKFKQILINLLSNAIKFSPTGQHIKVTSRVRDELLVLSVRDLGPGIPAEHTERIFDRFFKLESREHISAGTGLGLAICRYFVRLHGGEIYVERREAGAEFFVEIPVAGA